MYHLMTNLPVLGTLGVAALLVGPLARLPIDLGAFLLERFERWLRERVINRGAGVRRPAGTGAGVRCHRRGPVRRLRQIGPEPGWGRGGAIAGRGSTGAHDVPGRDR